MHFARGKRIVNFRNKFPLAGSLGQRMMACYHLCSERSPVPWNGSLSLGDGHVQDRSSRPPVRNAQGLETRAQILQAAGRIFAEKGFDGTSIRDISRDSGVGLSTIIYHFESKENIFLEAIRHFTVEMGMLNQHFEPLLKADVSNPQAVSDALRDAIHSFLSACHGPGKVEHLNGLYNRVMVEGNATALKMLLDCFASVQAGLPAFFKRIRPDLDDVQIAFLQQLLWSLLQYPVVSKRLILFDMKLKDDYTEEYLAAAAWHFAWYCSLPLGLPAPGR